MRRFASPVIDSPTLEGRDGAAARALEQAIARCGGVGSPQQLIRTALARAQLRAVPVEPDALARFVREHVLPLMTAQLPSVQHGEARAAFARVAAILGGAPRPRREGERTQQIVTRHFEEIFVLTADVAVIGALSELASSGARVERFRSGELLAAAIVRARGALLVVFDVRVDRSLLRDALTSARPPSAPMVAVVWGDESATRQAIASLPGVQVTRLPADASAEDLRAVVRLGTVG